MVFIIHLFPDQQTQGKISSYPREEAKDESKRGLEQCLLTDSMNLLPPKNKEYLRYFRLFQQLYQNVTRG